LRQVTAYETTDGQLRKTPTEVRQLELRIALRGWAETKNVELNPTAITEIVADAAVIHVVLSEYVKAEFGEAAHA
jgi:hypothetical protein